MRSVRGTALVVGKTHALGQLGSEEAERRGLGHPQGGKKCPWDLSRQRGGCPVSDAGRRRSDETAPIHAAAARGETQGWLIGTGTQTPPAPPRRHSPPRCRRRTRVSRECVHGHGVSKQLVKVNPSQACLTLQSSLPLCKATFLILQNIVNPWL